MATMSAFTEAKALLLDATERLATLAADVLQRGHLPRQDQIDTPAWGRARRKADADEKAALHAMYCLTDETATADELTEATEIMGNDKRVGSVRYYAACARALESSSFARGQRVKIKAPLRMGSRAGEMVEYIDHMTGRVGVVAGMTPDGQEVRVRFGVDDIDLVYRTRVEPQP